MKKIFLGLLVVPLFANPIKAVSYDPSYLTMIRDKMIAEIFFIEGGYVKNPLDSGGGETKYGISKKIARGSGYKGAMWALTKKTATKIYIEKYWVVLKLEKIFIASNYATAMELFDIGVNMGPQTAGKMLQKCLNVLNEGERYFVPIEEDGIIGTKTLDALAILISGDENVKEVLPHMLNSLQGSYYINLAKKRKKDKTFLVGWFKKRIIMNIAERGR